MKRSIWIWMIVAIVVVAMCVGMMACDSGTKEIQKDSTVVSQSDTQDATADSSTDVADQSKTDETTQTDTQQGDTTDTQSSQDEETEPIDADEQEQQAAEEGYEVTFVVDDNVTVTVYRTQVLENGEETLTALSRDSISGKATKEDGQVNFVLDFAEGYELDAMEVTEGYKNCKDLGNGIYRITKITDDITVTVTSKAIETQNEGDVPQENDDTEQEEAVEDGFQVTFVVDGNVTVTVYRTQVLEDGEEALSALSRDSISGKATKDDGQVNFVLTFAEGYELDAMEVTEGYKNCKDLGNGIYRITKITDDITVTITAKAIE